MQNLTTMTQQKKLAMDMINILADTYTLYLKTQNFHWNVTGPQFHSLHLLFEGQYQELALAIDEIAERIRALNVFVPASLAEFSKLSSLSDETESIPAQAMLEKLAHDHETISQHINEVLARCGEAHDQGSEDLLIQRTKIHDKAAWMLRSSLGS